jgi:ABC-type oligopeptide transport system ATPase subunit
MSRQPILEIKELRKHFPVKNVWGTDIALVKALDGVDLSIESGKTFGIVGESGCGKTTLMRTLLRLVSPSSGSVILSDQINDDFSSNRLEELSHEELRMFRRKIGVVFQDPIGALNPRMLIKDIVGEPLVIHGKTENLRERVVELLHNVGLGEEHLYRYPHEFSGGQRQRIVIARALALEPKILVLDEPTSALDVSVQAQILNLLNDLQEKYELTYIFISHDLSVIEYMCDRLAVMYLGKVVEEADTEELFSIPRHPYTRALLSATPSFEKDRKKIMILGDVPSPIAYLDESKARLATEITEQERLEIKAIEGKGIDYIVRSSLNEVLPLARVSSNHYARVKQQ